MYFRLLHNRRQTIAGCPLYNRLRSEFRRWCLWWWSSPSAFRPVVSIHWWWWHPLWGSQWSPLWYSHPCVNLHPLPECRLDLWLFLLTEPSRGDMSLWHCFKKLCTLSWILSLALIHLLAPGETSCYILRCVMKRSLWQITDISGQLPAGTWAVPTAARVSLEAHPPLTKGWDYCSPSWILDCILMGEPESGASS